MRYQGIIAFALLIVLCTLRPCSAALTHAGIIKTVHGQAFVVRDGATLAAEPEMQIHPGDVVKTGDPGGIGMIFSDDTIVSMGPETEFAIDTYLFEPVEGKLSFIAKILYGTISFITGQITKLSPESVSLETPAATIGVRGTRVLIKVAD